VLQIFLYGVLNLNICLFAFNPFSICSGFRVSKFGFDELFFPVSLYLVPNEVSQDENLRDAEEIPEKLTSFGMPSACPTKLLAQ